MTQQSEGRAENGAESGVSSARQGPRRHTKASAQTRGRTLSRAAATLVSLLWRQPLLWFLLAGGGLYLAHAWLEGRNKPTLLLSEDELAYLARLGHDEPGEAAPSPQVLHLLAIARLRDLALIDGARQMGLDRNDLIIERRLIQKMTFLLKAEVSVPDPDEATLRAFLEAHPERYREPEIMTFEQLFFAEGPACKRASAALPAIQQGLLPQSDPLALGRRFQGVTAETVQQRFGAPFRQALEAAPLGAWHGPVASRYGCHVIRVASREPERIPESGEIRERLQRDWREEAEAVALERAICRLVRRYRLDAPRELHLSPDDLCSQPA